MYTRETEIRHLSSMDVYNIGQILDPMQFWKKLMRIVPQDLSGTVRPGELKYNNDHIRLIECASTKDSRSCTEIFLDEWGCSGRKRPNLANLLDLLVKAELFRAADFVAVQLLNELPPQRPLKGPAAKIDISIPLEAEEVKQIEEMLDDASYPGTQTLLENKTVPSNINNRDYYEKLGRHEKKLDVVYSDLIRFSSKSISLPTTAEVEETTTAEIPDISALNVKNSEVVIPDLSALNVLERGNESQSVDSIQIPSGINNFGISSPTHSELNSFQIPAGVEEISNQSQETPQSTNSVNLSDQPNLSILQQDVLSSLNESSLTNVTSTEEENVLFPSNNSLSGNIPCLSALHQ